MMAPSPPPSEPVAGMLRALPRTAGAYALLLRLHRTTEVTLAAGRRSPLDPGLYLYAGSARGSGGLRARVARHLRTGKARHWHIDQITEVAAPLGVLIWPHGDECELVRGALSLSGASVPVPGFGSSDCRHCRAHLVILPNAAAASALTKRIGESGAGAGSAGDVRMLQFHEDLDLADP